MMKSEKGSITVFVLVVMLFFVIVLIGILTTTYNVRKNQKDVDTSIIDTYQKDVNMVDVIYNERYDLYQEVNNNINTSVNNNISNSINNNL